MRKTKINDFIFYTLNTVLLTAFTFVCVYPMLYILVYSFSDPITASIRGVYLFPVGFTLDNYRRILTSSNIYNAVTVSASRTVFGSLITVACSSLYAYLVTRRDLPFRRFFYRFLITSMYLGAGLIPWYIVMTTLRLNNSFALYIVPSAVSAFGVILIKTYIEQLPDAVEDAALIDGAGPINMLIKIILPLSLPILACITVFNAVGQWNAWQDNFFLVMNPRLKTLQLLLLEYMQSNRVDLGNPIAMLERQREFVTTPFSIRTTMTVITILPIACVYPFMQRYFVKGIMLGAVKG